MKNINKKLVKREILTQSIEQEKIFRLRTKNPKFIQELECCPCCGAIKLRYMFQRRLWKHWECLKCKFIYVNPRPNFEGILRLYNSEFMRFYQILLHQKNIKNKFYSSSTSIDMMEEIINLIHEYKKDGDLLDIGCGNGSFLKYSKSKGYPYKYFGTEIASVYYPDLQNSKDFIFIQETVQSILENKQKFDVITLIAVIEHIHDPFQQLNTISLLLQNKGILFLLFPIIGRNLTHQLIRSSHTWVSPPYHLNFFNYSSITALCKRIGGLKLLKYYEKGTAFTFHDLIKAHLGLLNEIDVDINSNKIRRFTIQKENFQRKYNFLTKILFKFAPILDFILFPMLKILEGGRIGIGVIKKIK